MEFFIVIVGKYVFPLVGALFIPVGLRLAFRTYQQRRSWIKVPGRIVDSRARGGWDDNAATHSHRYKTFYTAVVEFASLDGARHRIDAFETTTKPIVRASCVVRYDPQDIANAFVSTLISDWVGSFLFVTIGCVLIWLSMRLFWTGAFD
jgi:hypothetical protein